MSNINEPLEQIIGTLKNVLPNLKKILHKAKNEDIGTMHLAYEAIYSLIARYEHGEIVEKKSGKKIKTSNEDLIDWTSKEGWKK